MRLRVLGTFALKRCSERVLEWTCNLESVTGAMWAEGWSDRASEYHTGAKGVERGRYTMTRVRGRAPRRSHVVARPPDEEGCTSYRPPRFMVAVVAGAKLWPGRATHTYMQPRRPIVIPRLPRGRT